MIFKNFYFWFSIKLHCIIYFNWVLTEEWHIFSVFFKNSSQFPGVNRVKRISFSLNRGKTDIYISLTTKSWKVSFMKLAKRKLRKYLTAFKTTWWYKIESQFSKTINTIVYYILLKNKPNWCSWWLTWKYLTHLAIMRSSTPKYSYMWPLKWIWSLNLKIN